MEVEGDIIPLLFKVTCVSGLKHQDLTVWLDHCIMGLFHLDCDHFIMIAMYSDYFNFYVI